MTCRNSNAITKGFHVADQRGNILIIAIVYAGISVLTVSVMLRYLGRSSEMVRAPKIKSAMSATEAKVRSTLLSPSTYTCAMATDSSGGRGTCVLKNATVTALSIPLPGTKCKGGRATGTCGIDVIVKNYVALTAANETRVEASIEYAGNDLNLAPIPVIMNIPADLLQARGVYKCPDSAPIFLGLKPNGQLNCRSLPTPAGPGQFANKIDLQNMTISISSLPKIRSCPDGQIMKTIKWLNGGNDLETTCGPRPNAFTEFGFQPREPVPGPGDVVYTDNPDY